ncbi:hypothetical protein RQP53_23935 [Paucibacter sp. APW11]|uniref:Uncharacterized protein n=1 Tax=Roseateles aquae TaxID=3077235 RepID=A0ABU3PJN8_9BURK|nr:hypothetical protein [Paucibacter sp. APW11]
MLRFDELRGPGDEAAVDQAWRRRLLALKRRLKRALGRALAPRRAQAGAERGLESCAPEGAWHLPKARRDAQAQLRGLR